MPHFYRIRCSSSPVAADLDIVDVPVADRAGSMAHFAAGEQRLAADRHVIGGVARQPRREGKAAFRSNLQIVTAIVLNDQAAKTTQTRDASADAEIARLARNHDVGDV